MSPPRPQDAVGEEAIAQYARSMAELCLAWSRAWQGRDPSFSVLPDILARWIEGARGFDIGVDQFGRMIERMAAAPRFADVGDAGRTWAELLQAWMDLRQKSSDYGVVVSAAWVRASAAFQERLRASADSDTAPSSLRELFAQWSEIANAELLETQRSDTFLKAQREMLRAAIVLRRRQQELVADLSEPLGIPTRRELDDVHRSIAELRRELRQATRRMDRASEPH